MLVCVQGVIAAPRVHQCSQRDVHGVRLRAHDADVLVYDISVSTYCGNFRASVALSRWVLCEPSLLDWIDVEYAFLFWIQGGIPHVPWDVVVHNSWVAHHARNFGQVARVDAL